MTAMDVRPRSLRLLAAIALSVVVIVVACVPEPVGRTPRPPTASPSAAVATPVPTPTGPTPPPSFVRPTPLPSPTFFVYVVRSGDTLSSIARAFTTSPFSLAVWNRSAYPSLDPDSEGYDPDRIEVGWQLMLIPNSIVDEEVLLEPTPGPSGAGPSGSPSATPGGAAGPSPTGAAGPPPAGSGAATVVRHGPRSVPTVALTFDMGGRLDPALDILEWLVANDVPATIFPTGRTGTTTEQGRAALDAVSANRDLFDMGNHSWSHPDFRELDDAGIRDQLERTDAAVVAATGMRTQPWFRPPFGGIDDQIPAVVGSAGWRYVVLWDIDSIDWRPEADGGPTTDDIVAKVVGRAEGGSIVLLHLGGFNTLEALPGIVEGLRAKGLRPVTLAEMFPA
jgi:peptidoglycan/xylan/chitin deacetylase (PgdA/CDA1 family)